MARPPQGRTMGDSLHFAATALIFVSVTLASAGIGYRLLYGSKPAWRRLPPTLPYVPPAIASGAAVKRYTMQAEPKAVCPPPLPRAGAANAPSQFWDAWAVADEGSARKAARGAMWGAFFVAFITASVALLSGAGVSLFKGVGPAAWLDAVVFAALGVGIGKMSRTAAIGALVLYVLERFAMAPVGGLNPVMMIAMVICFSHGVRGTWAFHRFRQEPRYPVAMAQPSSS